MTDAPQIKCYLQQKGFTLFYLVLLSQSKLNTFLICAFHYLANKTLSIKLSLFRVYKQLQWQIFDSLQAPITHFEIPINFFSTTVPCIRLYVQFLGDMIKYLQIPQRNNKKSPEKKTQTAHWTRNYCRMIEVTQFNTIIKCIWKLNCIITLFTNSSVAFALAVKYCLILGMVCFYSNLTSVFVLLNCYVKRYALCYVFFKSLLGFCVMQYRLYTFLFNVLHNGRALLYVTYQRSSHRGIGRIGSKNTNLMFSGLLSCDIHV